MNQNNQYEALIELQETDLEQQRLVDEFKREHCSDGKSPLQDAGWFSRLLLNWMHPKFEVRSKSEFSAFKLNLQLLLL